MTSVKANPRKDPRLPPAHRQRNLARLAGTFPGQALTEFGVEVHHSFPTVYFLAEEALVEETEHQHREDDQADNHVQTVAFNSEPDDGEQDAGDGCRDQQ